jgi:hypothetical protein
MRQQEYTLQQAAALLGIDPRTLKRYLHRLHGVTLDGRTYKIPLSELRKIDFGEKL